MRSYVLSSVILAAFAVLVGGCDKCNVCKPKQKVEKCASCGVSCPSAECPVTATSGEQVNLCGQACVLRYAESHNLKVNGTCPCGQAGTVQFQRVTGNNTIQQYCGSGCYTAHSGN